MLQDTQNVKTKLADETHKKNFQTQICTARFDIVNLNKKFIYFFNIINRVKEH